MTQNIGKSYWATATGGTAAAITATIPGLDSLKHADIYIIPTPIATTGALTIDINGLGAVPVKTPTSADPSIMPANYEMFLIWNTSEFVLQNNPAGASSPQMVYWGGTATTTATGFEILSASKTGALVNGEIYEFRVPIFIPSSLTPTLKVNTEVAIPIKFSNTQDMPGNGSTGFFVANQHVSGFISNGNFVVTSLRTGNVTEIASAPTTSTYTFNTTIAPPVDPWTTQSNVSSTGSAWQIAGGVSGQLGTSNVYAHKGLITQVNGSCPATSASAVSLLYIQSTTSHHIRFGTEWNTNTGTYWIKYHNGTTLTSINTGIAANTVVTVKFDVQTNGDVIVSINGSVYATYPVFATNTGLVRVIAHKYTEASPVVINSGFITNTTYYEVIDFTNATNAVNGPGLTMQVKVASAINSGVVSTGAQTFAGVKTINSLVGFTSWKKKYFITPSSSTVNVQMDAGDIWETVLSYSPAMTINVVPPADTSMYKEVTAYIYPGTVGGSGTCAWTGVVWLYGWNGGIVAGPPPTTPTPGSDYIRVHLQFTRFENTLGVGKNVITGTWDYVTH